ncbi:NAD(P)H-hydrate dehydratase [Variovorax sp. RT4R15]|uniref:NAD(P)H-hydrate dehydratase n=1 Tax=Variovorax sp. RT4R15 TaxID=3443737 RepID=UPI003F489E01
MHRITPATTASLFGIEATRRVERAAAATLPPHTLMQRAGLAVARLAMAIAPHARTVWIACGPGNNGGDGLEAAAQLQQRGFAPVVTWLGHEGNAPPDARASLQRARAAGVAFAEAPPERWDLAIDALLGIGASRAPEGTMADWLQRMHATAAPVLSVDVPSSLNAESGATAMETAAAGDRGTGAAARFCLSLLTLKPGLFTAQGRDAAGEVWLDDLGCSAFDAAPVACLAGAPAARLRLEASHKGSYGDVAVIGGAPGMAGAALLAASAALHAGAGRVFAGLLDSKVALDASQPELMVRDPATLDVGAMTVVCGCGGGAAVRGVLPRLISTAQRLVIDADALNAIALDPGLQTLLTARGRRRQSTVLTPHPLEAARLLDIGTAAVQADRLGSAQKLANRFGAVVVLKGSGTVVAAPGTLPSINLTGNARLASAGTGDVLAGMVGAALASGLLPALDATRDAVWHHGNRADRWPASAPLTAGALARGRR